MTRKQKAIFLDRDGVINRNRSDYVRTLDQIEIFPQALKALAVLNQIEYQIVIVTNQSAVGRGLISLAQARAINEEIVGQVVAAGGRIDAVYMCPHAPIMKCSCRKPAPGLLLRAADELTIDLRHSLLVGDALSDIQAAQGAGLDMSVLVLSGRYQADDHSKHDVRPDAVYPDLLAAVSDIFPT